MGSSGSRCCKPTAASYRRASAVFQTTVALSSHPNRRADTGRAIRTSYAGRSSGIAQQPRGFRQPVRFARRGCGSLPTSRDPVCEHHLLSCRKGIIADPSRQEESAYTYKLINRYRYALLSSHSGIELGIRTPAFGASMIDAYPVGCQFGKSLSWLRQAVAVLFYAVVSFIPPH